MSALPFTAPAAYALARSSAEPVATFATAEQLAAAIDDRRQGRPYHVVSPCWCTARDPAGESTLSVYALDARGERRGFIGYVFGLGSDQAALHALIQLAAAARAEAA